MRTERGRSTETRSDGEGRPLRYLSPDEVAEILGVPKSFVYRRTCRGHPDALPSYRFGGHLRFRLADVEAWIEAHRREIEDREPMVLVASIAQSRRKGSTTSRGFPAGRKQI